MKQTWLFTILVALVAIQTWMMIKRDQGGA